MTQPMLRPFVRTLACCIPFAPAVPLSAQAGMPGGGGGSAPAHMAAYYAYMLEEVHAVTSAYESAWTDQDFEELADLFHEDAALVVDTGFRVRGREAILERLQELWSPDLHVRLTFVDFEASGDLGVVYGQLGDAPGKHITLVKRFGDDWRVVRQFLLGVEDAVEASRP